MGVLKMFQKTKMKIKNKIQSKIEKKVQEHDNWLIDKICHRIEILTADIDCDYNFNLLIADIKNGGYLENDKKECS